MDRILLNDLVFFGHHGVLPAERELGALFTVDLLLEVDLARARATDDLADTVDYRRAYEIARSIVEGPACKLIETVAGQIAALLLAMDGVRRVTVRVHKKPPLGGPFGSVAVEVTRPAG